MNRHGLAEARSLALHRAVGELLDEDPSILERARARVRHWLATGAVSAFWAKKWESILSRSNQEIRYRRAFVK